MAWIVAGIEKDVPRNDLLELLGLLADDSGGVKWAWEHGLFKTNFTLQEDDPDEAERQALAKFAGMVAEAGLSAETIKVLACVVSPPAPHVGWEWPAELRIPAT